MGLNDGSIADVKEIHKCGFFTIHDGENIHIVDSGAYNNRFAFVLVEQRYSLLDFMSLFIFK